MDRITLENSQEGGFVLDIGDLTEKLQQLVDPRKDRGKRFALA